MSTQYRERLSQPKYYEQLKDITECASCPGTCSCNLGNRSAFDKLQHEAMVSGKNNYAFDINHTRKLNLHYSVPYEGTVEHPIVEYFSGMHTPYNSKSYTMWPALSQKCNPGLGGFMKAAAGKGPQFRENYTSSEPEPWCTFAKTGGTFCYDKKRHECLPFFIGAMVDSCI